MKTFYHLSDETTEKVIKELNGKRQLEIAEKARIHYTNVSKIKCRKLRLSLNIFERLLNAGYLNLSNYPELKEMPDNIYSNLERIDAMNKLMKAA
jgi:transcriptional regulator with XRE-family HTH domain